MKLLIRHGFGFALAAALLSTTAVARAQTADVDKQAR